MNPGNPEIPTPESSDHASSVDSTVPGGLPPKRSRTTVLAVIGCFLLVIAVSIGLMLPAVERVQQAADRSKSQNNLKQIGLAMLNYAGNTKDDSLPAAALYDRDGKPLLSWRVAILPYLDQKPLYAEFHLDEPWDSPHNSTLLAKMPKTYQMPKQPTDFTTPYRVFHGPGAAFEGNRGVKLKDFPDGTANTILVIEADETVPWTKPEELEYAAHAPLPKLGRFWNGKLVQMVHADNSVRSIILDGKKLNLRYAILRNDGEILNEETGP